MDALLTAYLHDQLSSWKRQYVRVRLAFNPGLRQRLTELSFASAALAGAVGEQDAAAHFAHLLTRLRRTLVIDWVAISLVATALLASGALVWTSYLAANKVNTQTDGCLPTKRSSQVNCTKPLPYMAN